MPAHRPVAVVDCGTTSVRASIAEVRGDQVRVLEDLQCPVELTASFIGGKLTRHDMDGVIAAFEGIVSATRGYGIKELRAVGTSGLREAANADTLIEHLRTRLGVELEVIDAAEESRLYFEALRRLLATLPEGAECRELLGSTLLVEIGGGGSCISLIRDGKLVHSVDEHFGTHRLCEHFRAFRDSDDFAPAVDRLALGAARVILARLPPGGIDRVVVTGGVVRRLLALMVPGEASPLSAITLADVEGWWRRMLPLTPSQRGEACACAADEAATLLPAAALLRHLAGLSLADRVLVPQITLRDGLLADLLPGAQGPHHLDDSHLIAEAKQLAARYGVDPAYAENTASIAVQIFDQTRSLHGLGARERSLLQFSALVHDIGAYVNVRNRHKHTYYLIRASDIAGLANAEKGMVAHIARYHRRSAPQPHHAEYQAMPRRNRVVVGHLAAILRLAYALDVEREQRIRRIRCEIAGNRLLLRVDRRQVALERWSVAGKAGMIEDAFGLEVVVLPREDA